jgi:uncharacterized protein YbbK (DUF523 family)
VSAKFIISACLAGENVRYDGKNNFIDNTRLKKLINEGFAVLACPEAEGGLPTPRKPCEIKEPGGGKAVFKGSAQVYNNEGEVLTESFVRGAENILSRARELGCRSALLKQRSPSCGNGIIYDGTFKSVRIKGDGVLAALLRQNGFALFSEEELDDFLKHIEND